jgi:hypothetical protein
MTSDNMPDQVAWSGKVELVNKADLSWCIDILERIDYILKKKNVSDGDLSQVHWLVKQGLKVKREND